MKNGSFAFEISVTRNQLCTWKAWSKITRKKMYFRVKIRVLIINNAMTIHNVVKEDKLFGPLACPWAEAYNWDLRDPRKEKKRPASPNFSQEQPPLSSSQII